MGKTSAPTFAQSAANNAGSQLSDFSTETFTGLQIINATLKHSRLGRLALVKRRKEIRRERDREIERINSSVNI